MLFLLVLLAAYLVVVIGEDEGLGNVHGVVPTIVRFTRTVAKKSSAFV